ncbi:M4 family metallopeptidase [Actinoplanes siamensis]|uniref:Neutral metalloproteinase n=1 Tax=Actinoplanes siamensis TaxID=1223317 RepID=A0A919N5N6_9ACTN|nr:M4 family metallopeptidase [Actinoplanes siamensis]GIF04784.1 metalloprotease [Actinoplanes siamensis]
MTPTRTLSCITPPFILTRLLDSDNVEIRQAALATLLTTAQLRGERSVRGLIAGALATPADGRRSIFDCAHSTYLPSARLTRSENDEPVQDASVNRAYDGFGTTRAFFQEVFGRNSIDDRGLPLQGYVHRGNRYNNAFWDGRQMVFGDGDGQVFLDFTGSLDVIAHELTHGVTEHTAALEYHNQSGALNESMSDAFGSMTKQWLLRQTADQADWLIGAEVFTPHIDADALRSMKAPGTAFDNKLFGRDPQPDHMDRYVQAPDTEDGDNGGVHLNSGIPNKAFYLVATGIGGNSWEAPGHIWYESLKASTQTTDFQAFADTTYDKAGTLYGADSREQRVVKEAWAGVGIQITTAPTLGRG